MPRRGSKNVTLSSNQSISQSIDFRRRTIFDLHKTNNASLYKRKRANTIYLAKNRHFTFPINNYWNCSIDDDWFNYININYHFSSADWKKAANNERLIAQIQLWIKNMNEESINLWSFRTILHEHATSVVRMEKESENKLLPFDLMRWWVCCAC